MLCRDQAGQIQSVFSHECHFFGNEFDLVTEIVAMAIAKRSQRWVFPDENIAIRNNSECRYSKRIVQETLKAPSRPQRGENPTPQF
jgi:hypothetical protein